MFHPGIKIGPREGWQDILEKSGAQFCEVWFSIDDPISKYEGHFQYIKEHHIQAGLHFWGMLDEDIMPNIAYPDEHIWKPSLERMKHTLEIARQHDLTYVNIHVGNAALETLQKLPSRGMSMELVENSQVDERQAEKTFEQHVLELNTFAKSLNVNLFIETVPLCTGNYLGRLHPHKTYALRNVYLEELAKKHDLSLTNDISHTVAEFGQTQDRQALWKYLWDRTTHLLPYTKLVHMNTLSEPFNGTDSHDGILETDFEKNVFPTKTQLLKLLELFNAQQHIWIVNEPNDAFVENYRQLVLLQKQIHG